jgi:hypothetical protein
MVVEMSVLWHLRCLSQVTRDGCCISLRIVEGKGGIHA